jgi:ribosomal protein L7Ae-like RNA K-turn-binding protein
MNEEPSAVGRQLLALLGLARRAGKLSLGITAVERLVHKRGEPLILLASDAGGVLRRRVERLAPVRGPVSTPLTRQELAAAFKRDDLAVVAVADAGFVRGITALGLADQAARKRETKDAL